MSRFVTRLVLWPASVLACASASAGSPEGFYSIGGRAGATIRLAPGKEPGTLVGVVVSARSPYHEQQMNQTVLELRQAKEGAFRGRCNAYHVRASEDMEAWLDAEASLLPNGSLRCSVKVPGEGSVQFVYERAAQPGGGGEPGAEPGDLSGEWADATGAVAVYRREGEIYVGQIVRPAEPGKGPARKETIRVKAMKPGVYKGTIEFSRAEGGTVDAVEDIELAVRGDALTSTRTTRAGKVASTAQRLVTKGEKAEPPAKAPAAVDPGDLCGKWRAANGDTTRYTRDGSRYTGYLVAIAPEKKGYGFVIGDVGVRLTRVRDGFYVGKVLVRTEGGKDFWWEDVEFTVEGDELRHVRYMVNGKQEKGRCARVGGLQDTAPAAAPKSP